MTIRAILADPAYLTLKGYVLNHTGLTYFADKDEDFATRISRRIAALKVPNCSAYLARLDQRGASLEVDALVGELTIGETYFFRQIEHFDLLQHRILPDLLRRRRESRQLRIWSAGCAIGAEPYSIAMLLHLEFAASIQGWDIHILGTDINMDFLAQARIGSFSDWALRDVPPEKRSCCFQEQAKRWILNPEIRNAVTFRYHNLAANSAPPTPDGIPFDLILCRNVMIYFSQDRSRAVGEQFYGALREGGWLLVGHAESSAELFPQFQLVRETDVMAYRKPPHAAEVQPIQPIPWEPWVDPGLQPAPEAAADPLVEPPAQAERSEPESLDLARTLADRGEWTQAGAVCRSLLEKDPLLAPAHFLLGLILPHTSSPAAAEAALRRAIYVDRNFALAHYHLGALLQTARDVQGARRAFRNTMHLLQPRPAEEVVEYGDGITVEELRELTRMHQEILGE